MGATLTYVSSMHCCSVYTRRSVTLYTNFLVLVSLKSILYLSSSRKFVSKLRFHLLDKAKNVNGQFEINRAYCRKKKKQKNRKLHT